MLFFFAPAGIEALFDELEHFHPSADPAAAIAALNAIGEKYGARYFLSVAVCLANRDN